MQVKLQSDESASQTESHWWNFNVINTHYNTCKTRKYIKNYI